MGEDLKHQRFHSNHFSKFRQLEFILIQFSSTINMNIATLKDNRVKARESKTLKTNLKYNVKSGPIQAYNYD